MGTNEGTNFSNRQIPYGFVVVLAQELRARQLAVSDQPLCLGQGDSVSLDAL